MSRRWAMILWTAIFVAVLGFLWAVRAILPPFAAAVFLALLLNPWILALQRSRGYSRTQSVLLVYLLFLLVVLAPILWLWRPIYDQATQLATMVPVSINRMQRSLRGILLDRPSLTARYRIKVPDPAAKVAAEKARARFGPPAPDEEPLAESVPEAMPTRWETNEETVDRVMGVYVGQISRKVEQLGPALIGGVVLGSASMLSRLLNVILVPIITFFLLIDLEKFRRQGMQLIPRTFRRHVVDTLDDIGDVFIKYIRGLVTAAAIYAGVSALEYWALDLPYPLVLGLLAGLLYFIPYIGPLVTVSLVAATAAISPVPHHLLGFIAIANPLAFTVTVTGIALVVYFVFDQLVTPRVVGGAVGLHPVFAFFAIMAGATLFGIPGMLLAYPVAGSIRVILNRVIPALLPQDDDEPSPSPADAT